MPGNIKATSSPQSNPDSDSLSQGWQTVNANGQTTPSLSSSKSDSDSTSEGPTIEHIEDIANLNDDDDDKEEGRPVISGPLAERLVSEAITTTPAAAAVVASEATITEDSVSHGDIDGDADADASTAPRTASPLQFWKNETESGYRGDAAGKRACISAAQYAEAGRLAEGEFKKRLRRIQEIMGLNESKRLYPFPSYPFHLWSIK